MKELAEEVKRFLDWAEAPEREYQETAEVLVQSVLGQALDIAQLLNWQWGAGSVQNVRDALEVVIQERNLEPWKAAARPQYRKRILSANLRRQIMERDGYRCQWADCATWIDLTVDHIVPEIEGGTDDPANLQTLCRPHNSSKGVRVL